MSSRDDPLDPGAAATEGPPQALPGAQGSGEPLFERTRILIGDDGVAHLRGLKVLVAGLGGVGSFAAEALARAGVGELILADGDQVTPSNLNRQLVALNSTLGMPKTEVMAARIRDIHPDCRVTLLARFLAPEDMRGLFADGGFHRVVDAIDSLASKVALIAESVRAGVPVASSMGAGGRLDPARVRIGDLSETRMCPLARAVRSRLRKLGIERGVTAVWSDEPPLPPLPPAASPYGAPRAVNGTLSFMPPLFGLMLAGTTIRQALGQGSPSTGQ